MKRIDASIVPKADSMHQGFMAKVTDDDVRARKAEVDDLIVRYETILVMLRKEQEGLEGALQVMDGLHRRPNYPKPPEFDADDTSVASEVDAQSVPAKGESRKPADLPPMPSIIIEALLSATDDGREGLEPHELTGFVRERYWPGAVTGSVLPTAWRMVKDGRLTRAGELYALPPSLTAAITENTEVRQRVTSILGDAMRTAGDA